jgi:5,10-methylenetetrahydromethanopterin reductase
MARLGVALGSGLSPLEIVECVRLAEDCGYESAWVIEGHGGDQFSILTACGLATKRIKLGTAISSVYVRSAPTIAMAAACVDYYCGGRFVLGLGSSHRVQVLDEHGIAYAEPLERVRETLEVVRLLLRDGTLAYAGRLISIKNFDLWFTPLRKEIPIYLSAVFPKMLELCGRTAQGVILTWRTVESIQAAIQQIGQGARAARRPVGEIDIANILPCSVDDDHTRAYDLLRPVAAFYAGFFPRYNRLIAESGFADAAERIRAAWRAGDRAAAARAVPDALVASVSVSGKPAECLERLRLYGSAGVTLPIVFPAVDPVNAKISVMRAIEGCAPFARHEPAPN